MCTILFHLVEQFEYYGGFGNRYLDLFTLEATFIFLTIIFLLSLFFHGENNYNSISFLIKNFLQILGENLKAKFKNEEFFKSQFFIFCSFFFIVFCWNIFNIMPETLSITSFLCAPLLMSTISFIAATYFIISQNASVLFIGFMPKNLTFIDPIIVAIEIISFLIRLFSLAIRLFINILAGHILLKFISIVIIFLINVINVVFIIEFFIFIVNTLLFFLEIMACLLQSIILTSLIVIYIDGALNFKTH